MLLLLSLISATLGSLNFKVGDVIRCQNLNNQYYRINKNDEIQLLADDIILKTWSNNTNPPFVPNCPLNKVATPLVSFDKVYFNFTKYAIDQKLAEGQWVKCSNVFPGGYDYQFGYDKLLHRYNPSTIKRSWVQALDLDDSRGLNKTFFTLCQDSLIGIDQIFDYVTEAVALNNLTSIAEGTNVICSNSKDIPNKKVYRKYNTSIATSTSPASSDPQLRLYDETTAISWGVDLTKYADYTSILCHIKYIAPAVLSKTFADKGKDCGTTFGGCLGATWCVDKTTGLNVTGTKNGICMAVAESGAACNLGADTDASFVTCNSNKGVDLTCISKSTTRFSSSGPGVCMKANISAGEKCNPFSATLPTSCNQANSTALFCVNQATGKLEKTDSGSGFCMQETNTGNECNLYATTPATKSFCKEANANCISKTTSLLQTSNGSNQICMPVSAALGNICNTIDSNSYKACLDGKSCISRSTGKVSVDVSGGYCMSVVESTSCGYPKFDDGSLFVNGTMANQTPAQSPFIACNGTQSCQKEANSEPFFSTSATPVGGKCKAT